MILVLGEILFDLFPDYRRIGGAPFNFAFHLNRLGFDTRFVSGVGADVLGKEILAFIEKHGLDTGDIQTLPGRDTGTVKISMDPDGGHTFSILPDRAYDHLEWNHALGRLCAASPELVYFGTLVQRTSKGQALVNRVLDKAGPGAVKFCDINLRPGCHTPAVVAQSIARSDILKLSLEELDILVPGDASKIRERAAALLATPGPKRVILTRGHEGSLWVSRKGHLDLPKPELPGPVRDTVGAGDAYAAMAAAGRLSGLADHTTMALAQEFASFVCTIEGALPEDITCYNSFKSRLVK